MDNMLRVRLLEGTSSRAWVEKVPGIMLALNAMVTSRIVSRRPWLLLGASLPFLQTNAFASPTLNNPADYVEMLKQRISMTHQQMITLANPAPANPYQEGSLIFVMTTPPERTHKLTPR